MPDSPAAASPGGSAPGRDSRAVRLLISSPLFDAAWYAGIAGCSREPGRAAAHYLRHANRRGLWPHPLFVPEHVKSQASALVGQGEPLFAYLEQQLFDVSPHPLFEVEEYLRAHPGAAKHEHGPLAHYLTHGAAAGWAPNGWYEPHPQHPGGLSDWSAERWSEWSQRRQAMPRERVAELATLGLDLLLTHAAQAGAPAPVGGRVSVVVEARRDLDELVATLRSVARQELPDTEAIVVSDGSIPDLQTQLAAACPELVISVVLTEGSRVSSGLNLAVERAGGDFLAWAVPGETWEPGRLRLLLDACLRDDLPLAYDSRRVRRPGKADVYAASQPRSGRRPTSLTTVDLGRVLVRREAVLATGGFDEALAGGWEADLVFRMLAWVKARHVAVVASTRDSAAILRGCYLDPALRPVPDHSTVPTWTDVAFNRHALDWAGLGVREQRTDVVSVVIPTHEDFQMTEASVATVLAAEVPDGMSVECIVLDNGSGPLTSQVLDALGRQHDRLLVVHVPSNLGYALGNNLALPHVTGATVVFLNNDTLVDRGWLGPLIDQLADPDVLAAQSLLLYPTGTIQCAGVAFPDSGGLPYPFLAGFPVEDADGIDALEFSALTGAALAMRWDDVVTLRGFDPLFRNGMEDVDICLRLGRLRPGRCVVTQDSRVTHLESRTPGRFAKVVRNRRLYLDRWRDTAPRDDGRLWATRGFDVVGHVVRNIIDEDRRLCTPEPVLVRAPARVSEPTPRLRWAIKTGLSTGEQGDVREDARFARCLAEALRDLGQEVVIDGRHEFYRASGHLDDVVLTIRGREEFRPAYGQINLAWVISHPERLSRHEATSYDRVLAASESWSKRMAEVWGIQIDPLLQATDPVRFTPGIAAPDSGHRVLYVGDSHGVHRQMVQDAIEADLPLAVFGSQWEDLIPARYVQGESVPGEQLSAMYAAAGVVLVDHGCEPRVDGFLSNQLFDAAASGARVVTDDVGGLDGIFGSSVQVVRGATDLADLLGVVDLDRVFGGPEQRRDVALRVRREQSLRTRARRLLDVSLEVHGGQWRRT